MASTAARSMVPQKDLESFQHHLNQSTRILALLGAGLSASSGLPTFRGAGGLWRTHDATQLATPSAFDRDPGLVWQFYSYRRHMALKAKPNPAHYALAELAKQKKEDFMTLSQNVDGLSPRAGHPAQTLKLLHGSLFDVKCSDFFCQYIQSENYTDPIVPALAIPTSSDDTEVDPTTNEAIAARELDISDENVALPELSYTHLPRCPTCKRGLLRPGVVWFGEMLPTNVLVDVENWMAESKKIDLILVIGTSAKVYPAAGFVDLARAKGARVAVVNMDRNDIPASGMYTGDWFFEGDAAQIVPEILRPVVGDLKPEEMVDQAEGRT